MLGIEENWRALVKDSPRASLPERRVASRTWWTFVASLNSHPPELA